VPFSELEITAEVDYIGEVKLADYKKIKVPSTAVSVTAKDIEQVLDNLAGRSAEKKTVDRAIKSNDEAVIDFAGYEIGSEEVIPGTDGKDYPLVIGSNSFIPGFEEELIGLKTKESKSFDITFPKNYSAKTMQDRKVTFKVSIKEVKELVVPKIDDKFATTVGPFKTLSELKADIKKQLTAEKKQENQQIQENKILEAIAEKAKFAIPDSLINEEIERMEAEEKRNIIYRGQTWQEHLSEEGLSEEEHREKQRPTANIRVKTGIILGEIAEAEKIKVTEADFEKRMQDLRQQYPDQAMQAEL
jgi:trigger factor